tara:strand:+ start:2884 stop:3525 length:642 start_codon:yes stop_codon:yes gene_type:complete
MSIYLYGLQRSGTNVLTDFLINNYNIKIHNENTEDRNSIQHKHCRIYDNKEFIPNTDVIKQYYNEYFIDSINKLDYLLGDETNSNKYIIVYKDIFEWLPSINEWANKCNWVTKEKMDFVNDYKEYMKKWEQIKNERVLFISYTEYLNLIVNNDNKLSKKIEEFLNCKKNDSFIFSKKVGCSDVFTIKKIDYYINKRYMDLYTNEEIKLINAYN